MTLYELSVEYAKSADLLWGRISALERQRKEEPDEGRRGLLEGRIRPLRAMYRETRAVARRLERYYIKFTPRRDRVPSPGIRSLYPMDHRRRK